MKRSLHIIKLTLDENINDAVYDVIFFKCQTSIYPFLDAKLFSVIFNLSHEFLSYLLQKFDFFMYFRLIDKHSDSFSGRHQHVLRVLYIKESFIYSQTIQIKDKIQLFFFLKLLQERHQFGVINECPIFRVICDMMRCLLKQIVKSINVLFGKVIKDITEEIMTHICNKCSHILILFTKLLNIRELMDSNTIVPKSHQMNKQRIFLPLLDDFKFDFRQILVPQTFFKVDQSIQPIFQIFSILKFIMNKIQNSLPIVDMVLGINLINNFYYQIAN